MPTATGAEGSRRPSVDLDAPKLSDEESDDQDVSRRTSEADTTSDDTQLLSGPDADEATAEQRVKDAPNEEQQASHEVEDATMLALEALEQLIATAKATQHDLKETIEAGLAPARSLRLRRKSKDLEKSFADMAAGALERVFFAIDKDGSGTLEPHELKKAFEAFGRPASDETIRSAIKALDTDNDGAISLEEWKMLAWKVMSSAA